MTRGKRQIELGLVVLAAVGILGIAVARSVPTESTGAKPGPASDMTKDETPESTNACPTVRWQLDRLGRMDALTQVPVLVRAQIQDVSEASSIVQDVDSTTGIPLSPFGVYHTGHAMVTAIGRGNVRAGDWAIRIPGGAVGCKKIEIEGMAALTPGVDVILLCWPGTWTATAEPSDCDVWDAWAINETKVDLGDGQTLDVDAVLKIASGS